MGEIDITLKTYLSSKERFADLINGIILNGESHIKAEELELLSPVHNKADKKAVVERSSDIAMCQTDGRQNFLLYFIQNQEYIDYSMPIRIMLNEALEYDRQRKERQRINQKKYEEFRQNIKYKNGVKISQKNELEADKTGHFENEQEFLSKIRKEDLFTPVITLIIYWGKREWDGAKSLYELLDFSQIQKEFVPFITNYHINFFHVDDIKNLEFFQTDLRLLFGIYQCRNDRKKYQDFIGEHREELSNIDKETYFVIAQLTNSKQFIKWGEQEKKEEYNMCQALDEICLEAERRGEQRGEQQFAALGCWLVEQGRSEEFLKAASDIEYRKQLYMEFQEK